jgi:hypothetical protein
MKKIMMKFNKPIAILLVAALLVPMFMFSMDNPGTSVIAQDQSEDERIAAEVSNMTGVSTKELLELRQSAKSWQEVLEKLKYYEKNQDENSRELRSKTLSQLGLEEDFSERLTMEFKNEEIMEARLIVERLIFQLQEITEKEQTKVLTPSVEVNEVKQGEIDISSYEKLLEELHLETAIYLSLKLDEDFGSIEAVLDEYLFALQMDLQFETYLNDKTQYMKNREEKSLGITQDKVITLAKIEEKMIEQIQSNNYVNQSFTVDTGAVSTGNENQSFTEDHVESPIPEVRDVKPQNPADQIREELKVIDPNKTQ